MNYLSINLDNVVTIEKDNLEALPDVSGTSLQDYVEVSYKDLVNLFGEPNSEGDNYKTDAEWTIMTPDGVATIYNYKDGHNYNGEEGSDVWDITDWHIGGRNKSVVNWIVGAIKNSIKS